MQIPEDGLRAARPDQVLDSLGKRAEHVLVIERICSAFERATEVDRDAWRDLAAAADRFNSWMPSINKWRNLEVFTVPEEADGRKQALDVDSLKGVPPVLRIESNHRTDRHV
ncbi:hypothetical protein GCM10022288_26920 [Gryllotalpicola kribbensis]|uniref:Uncharacterized protein n=1 Tax=Gryllotalpicola kribbensis TaxID=993084 RepID=A0ABP8AYL7_9MICO